MNYRLFKIIVVGDGGVGKTTILHRYIEKEFLEDTKMTIGTNFFVKDIEFPDQDLSVKLQIWDLGGQSHFSAIRQNFYSGTKGVIYTFDLVRRYTFNNLLDWKKEVENVIGQGSPCVLVGNKVDLITNENLSVSDSDIRLLQKELSFTKYIQTSAKENIGIYEAFQYLAQEIVSRYQKK